MKRVLILVEGQTEERFVKDVLLPHLQDQDVFPTPKLATTKRVKSGPDFKGGISSFKKIEDDIKRLLNDSDAALVTTMLDFYAFPRDFAGWNAVDAASPYDRVAQLELALKEHFDHQRFLPYLMLHEYEAMLFAVPDETAKALSERNKAEELRSIRNTCTGPEKIDEGTNTAPSKRIQNLFPSYQKALHGPTIVLRAGLSLVRQACPHLDEWLNTLENL